MNDYGNPNDLGGRGGWFDAARQRVQAPGTCLLIYGIISVFLAVLSLGIYVANPDAAIKPIYDWQADMLKDQPKQPGQKPALPPYEEYRESQKIQGIAGSAISLVCSVLIFLGGSKMKHLQGYGLAITGSILSIIPCTNSCCCIGTPLGIWAIVVLLNSDVKLAFSRTLTDVPPDRDVPQEDRPLDENWESRRGDEDRRDDDRR
jgi:hypothetical protein